MDFFSEELFDTNRYEECLRRIHYDDRDVIMYENMLNLLWGYVTNPGSLKDYPGILEEYTHWNLQMIDRCYTHLPHDLPYINTRRAYQSVVHLLEGNLTEGMEQLRLIGKESFSYDGRAPKTHMSREGRCFPPTSRLFLIYNYAKALEKISGEVAEEFCNEYSFAFTSFADGKHEEHDEFLKNQMEVHREEIFYPIYERIYKLPGGPQDFFLYFDEEAGIPLERISAIKNLQDSEKLDMSN